MIVIPSRHDRYTPVSVNQCFTKNIFLMRLQEPKNEFSKPLNDHLCVIGFDASRPFMVRSNGMLTKTLGEELDQEFSRVKKNHKNVILMGHFPYSYQPMFPQNSIINSSARIY